MEETQPSWAAQMIAESFGQPEVQQTEVGQVQSQTQEQQPQVVEEAVVPVVETTSAPSIEDLLKEQTGLSSWEEIKAAINKQYEPTYENETSKVIDNLIRGGKEDDLESIFYDRKFVKEVLKKGDEDLLKAYIKYTNPLFDDALVGEQFELDYKVDELSDRLTQIKAKQKQMTDLQSAKKFFTDKLENLKLPELPKQESIDEELAQYGDQLLEGVKKIDKGNLEYKFSDKENNISFDTKFFDEKAFNELKQELGRDNGYWDRYMGRYFPDGKPNPERFLMDQYKLDNFDKIIDSYVSQAVHNTKLAIYAKDKNITETKPHQEVGITEDPLEAAIYNAVWKRK